MPSLSLKKLFKSKKEKESDSDNSKTEKSRTKQTSGAKRRLASFTSTFRRGGRLNPPPAEPHRNAVFESQITEVVPLPPIPRVASTLRRDLARFKPLPLLHGDESKDTSEPDSIIDTTSVSPVARSIPLATYTIRRKPVSLGYASNHRNPATRRLMVKSTIRRKPVPFSEVSNNHFFCPRTLGENGNISKAKGASAADHISTADFIHSKQDSPTALITASDAAAPQPRSPTVSSSPSRVISVSEFPLPRIQQTSPHTLYHAHTSVQIARNAVYLATTAADAQQALLDLAGVSASSINSTIHNNDVDNGRSQESSGDTALTVYTPPLQDEWTPVEAECASLKQMVGQFRQSRMSRDARRQSGIIRALQSDKAKVVAENESLAEDLAAANAMVRVERTKKEQFQRHFEEAPDAHNRMYNQKTRLAEEQDIARNMAEESGAAAKSSDDHNKELFGKIASREYIVCQAKIVLDRAQTFTSRTGHSPEEWHQRTVMLTQELIDLRNRSAACDANLAELTSQLTETANMLTETVEALKKSQADAWTFKHLLEEAERTLSMSQRLHKEAVDLVESLQKQVQTQEVTLKVERTCAERLLADAMRENAGKDEHINRLRSALSISPESPSEISKLLDLATQQLSDSEERRILAQRATGNVLELLETEQAKSEGLTQADRELRNELGQLRMELDIANDEKAGFQEELVEAHKDFRVTEENARLWQMLAEQRLDELSTEEQAEAKEHALRELRKQLEQAQQEVQYYRQKNQTVREDAADLEYDLCLHQQRLANDAGQELSFYQMHWEQMKWVFDENKELKIRLDGLEQRFAADLKMEPLQLTRDPHAHESFEEAIGPEFIAQSIAMVKGQWGSHNPEKPCLTEKIQGIYGFGPAGPPSDGKLVEMPEGYLERKAVRQGMEGEGGFEDGWKDVEEIEMEQV